MINNKWYKFLLQEGSRHFARQNIRYIGFLPIEKGNYTLLNLSKIQQEDEFVEILQDSNTFRILKDYEIDRLIGRGAMGLAFSLKEPHENYILKFQILNEDTLLDIGEVGTEYTTHLYKKQEKEEFDPKELRVLDSEKGFGTTDAGEKLFVSATVMAKASEFGTSGKTGRAMSTENVMNDIMRTRVKYIIMNIVDYKHALDAPYKRSIANRVALRISEVATVSNYEKERIEQLLKNGDNKNLFRLIYSILNNNNLFNYLSEEQFVGICLQLYKIMDESFAKTGHHATLDLHGGNFGFRPNSDIPIFFDI